MQEPAQQSQVRDAILHFQRMVQGYAQRSLRAARHLSRSLLPGEFRSPYHFPEGIERDVPRVFQPDDDVQYLDTRRISPTLASRSLAEAVLQGDLRLIQAVRLTESEFVILVDLSRSMLAGLLDDGTGGERRGRKLEALYCVVAACTQVAEVSGFAIRTILVAGERVEESRVRTPRHLSQRLVAQMSDRLIRRYRKAEEAPESKEGFRLGAALRLVLAARRRGVLAVVSDFLDPIEGYGRILAQAGALHQTILFDVAAPWELNFPVPKLQDWGARHLLVREGARHLELGTEPASIDRHVIWHWNDHQSRNRELLDQIASGRHMRVVRSLGKSLEELFFIAWLWFDRAR